MADAAQTCKSHWRLCNLHFSSDDAFDAHVVYKPEHAHLDPRDVKVLRIRTKDATCEMSAEPEHGVTLWEHGPKVDRTRARRERLDSLR